MAIIRSDNPEIEKELVKLEDLVSEGGGGVHSELVISSEGGALALRTAGPMKAGREIIRLSRGTLLPSDQYDVVLKGDEFRAQFKEKSSFSPLQRKIAERMMALYTLTGKAQLHKKYSFLLSLADFPDVLDAVTAGRRLPVEMLNWIERIKAGLSPADLEEFVAKTFLKTRYLGYQDHVRTFSVSVLMPIIDFLNHHWQGAMFDGGYSVRQGDLAVNCAQPMEGSLECFAYYGIMDAFDALIRYDFIDESSPIIRSVPLDLKSPEGLSIRTNGAIGAINTEKLDASMVDLTRLMPILAVDSQTRDLTCSHLMIPTNGSPHALRRVLAYLLIRQTQRASDNNYVLQWIADAEQRIIEANFAYYKGLADKIRAHLTVHPGHHGLARLLSLAELQLERLAAYNILGLAPLPEGSIAAS